MAHEARRDAEGELAIAHEYQRVADETTATINSIPGTNTYFCEKNVTTRCTKALYEGASWPAKRSFRD